MGVVILNPIKSVTIAKRAKKQQPEYSCQRKGQQISSQAMDVVGRTYPYGPTITSLPSDDLPLKPEGRKKFPSAQIVTYETELAGL